MANFKPHVCPCNNTRNVSSSPSLPTVSIIIHSELNHSPISRCVKQMKKQKNFAVSLIMSEEASFLLNLHTFICGVCMHSFLLPWFSYALELADKIMNGKSHMHIYQSKRRQVLDRSSLSASIISFSFVFTILRLPHQQLHVRTHRTRPPPPSSSSSPSCDQHDNWINLRKPGIIISILRSSSDPHSLNPLLTPQLISCHSNPFYASSRSLTITSSSIIHPHPLNWHQLRVS